MNFVAAMLYAVAVSVLAAIALGFSRGGLDSPAAMMALTAGLTTGLLAWWRGRGAFPPLRPRGWEWVPVIAFATFSLRSFLWLCFPEGDELRVLSRNNLGDLALHITFIEYFANGAPFWPDSPIFAAGKLTYSAGMDLFNSLLSLVGVDLARGLIWTGLLGAFATGVALMRWGGAFTLAGFLFSGGLAGLACFDALPDLPFFEDYQANWAWKNLALAILVTQRGFLFALPAGLLLLGSWRSRLLGHDGWKLPVAGELLLYAAMPAFHLHTFLALSFMLAAIFIAHRAARWPAARLVAAALIPATVLTYLTLGTLKTNAEPIWEDMSQFENPPPRPPVEGPGWQPGWMVNDGKTAALWNAFEEEAPSWRWFAGHGKFLIFWLGNFGILPALIVVLLAVLLGQILRRRIPPALVLGCVVAVFVLTPLPGMWPAYREAVSGPPGSADGIPLAPFFRNAILLLSALPLLAASALFVCLQWRMSSQPGVPAWHSAMALPALFLFFVCCNVRFSNWDWDNTKLMLWSYVIVLPVLWEGLLVKWRPVLRGTVCVVLFFSGFVTVFGGIDGKHRGFEIARASTLESVSRAVSGIPLAEPFACEPTYNHPLALCGRKVVMGYEGHLSSHGISYRAIADDLDALMLGHPDWRLRAARLGVRYLYFGPGERLRWPYSYESWRKGATLIASGDWGELFDLDTPPLPVEERPPVTLR